MNSRRQGVGGLGAALAALFCLLWAEPCLGCFGARPLAMGGAFVAVADDVHATYWNPAGLVKVASPEVSATFDTDWQDLNYDVFAGLAAPLGQRAGAGLLYVYNEDDLGLGGRREDHYLQAAAGLLVLPWGGEERGFNLSVGLAGKYVERTLGLSGVAEETDGGFDLDLAFLLDVGPVVGPRQRMFSLGLLLQNVLESRFDYGLLGHETFAANVRPALAFRPDAWTVLALEIYDATERAGSTAGVRLGAERWLSLGMGRPVLALRAGAYHLNQDELRAYTFGVGIRPIPQAEISYALMYWTEIDQTTHLLAVGWQW